MNFTEQDFNEGMEKAAADAAEWRLERVKLGAELTAEGRGAPKPGAGFEESRSEPPTSKVDVEKEEQGDIGKSAAALADHLATAYGLPAKTKIAQGFSVAPGPMSQGGMPQEPQPGFMTKHPTATVAGGGAAGAGIGGALGYGAEKAIGAFANRPTAGTIGAGVGATLGSILGAAIGSREAEHAEESYSRQLVDYLSKISMDKSAKGKVETAPKTRKALEAKKLLKKTSALGSGGR
ncbi:MAG: hypothetical protein ABIP48_00920 [Planctomycetota bacterium]